MKRMPYRYMLALIKQVARGYWYCGALEVLEVVVLMILKSKEQWMD